MKLLKAITKILIRQTKDFMGEIMMPIGFTLVFTGIIWFISEFVGLTREQSCKFLMESYVILVLVLIFVMSIKSFITEVTKEYRRNNK